MDSNIIEETHFEYWDILDGQRNFTGKIHKRGEPLPQGYYHLVVAAWIFDSSGHFLIQRRSLTCSWSPGIWGMPGGSALSGEDSLTAVLREAKEEAGILLNPVNAELFCSYRHHRAFYDHWLFAQDFDLSKVTLQDGETMDARTVTWDEIYKMKTCGEFINKQIMNTPFDAFDLLKEQFSRQK